MSDALEGFKIVKNGPQKYWEDIIVTVAKDKCWNYSIDDYHINRRCLDFNAYFAIEIATDTVVGIITVANINLTNRRLLTVISTFYLLPKYRNYGIGWWLTKRAWQDAGENIFVAGVPLMWEKYRNRLGLDKILDYSIVTYAADLKAIDVLTLHENNGYDSNDSEKHYGKICDWREVDFELLHAYDASISFCERAAYLKNSFEHNESVAKVATNELSRLTGYCRIRRVLNQQIDIGPFCADDPETARHLLHDCMRKFLDAHAAKIDTEHARVFLKAPSTNAHAKRIFDELAAGKAQFCDAYVLQFTKEPIELPVQCIYSYSDACSTSTV